MISGLPRAGPWLQRETLVHLVRGCKVTNSEFSRCDDRMAVGEPHFFLPKDTPFTTTSIHPVDRPRFTKVLDSSHPSQHSL